MPTNLSRLIKAICSRAHEREGYVTKTKLLKYLYLLDIAHYRRAGTLLTGFSWKFHLYGPWAEEYESLYAQLVQRGDIRITPGTRPDLETEFISSSERVDLSQVAEVGGLELEFRRIIDTWADRRLGEMLDYVYFYTEPMEEARRGAQLEFHRVARHPQPQLFELPRRSADRAALERLRRAIEARKAQLPTPTVPGFTPPPYDEHYFEALRTMDEDDGY